MLLDLKRAKSDGGIKVSSSLIFLLSTVFFPRIFTSLGAPKLVNFLHFPVVLVVFLAFLPLKRDKHATTILGYLLAILFAIFLSAVTSQAGVINVVLDFLIITEWFLVLLLFVNSNWSEKSIRNFRWWLIFFAIIHLGLAYFQRFVLGKIDDGVQGVFIGNGAGAHLAGAVSCSMSIYIAFCSAISQKFLKLFLVTAFAIVAILSDAKQVIAVFLATLIVMFVLRATSWRKIFSYGLALLCSSYAVLASADTFYPALMVWDKPNLLIAGIRQKFSVFSVIVSHYNSWLNWFTGLGPGHTIGRLALLADKYKEYLFPLGFTSSPVTKTVWTAQQANYITNSETGTSLFSLFFSWAAIWGDLGLVGLIVYGLLFFYIYKHICLNEVAKFLCITIILFGVVFDWLAEPGYMVFMACLIGLLWQEEQLTLKTKAGNACNPSTS